MNFDGLDKIRRLMEPISKLHSVVKPFDPLLPGFRSMLNAVNDRRRHFDGLFTHLKHDTIFAVAQKANPLWKLGGPVTVLDRLRAIHDAVNSSVELQFIVIADLQLLSLTSTIELKESIQEDEANSFISHKEETVDNNLLPYLEELGVSGL